ncbi:MAG: hypothetical protein M9916_11465 [Crocinitomicaceae bacterium]|nr:hypothetical protein [Crocinitomicaceae bacterium]
MLKKHSTYLLSIGMMSFIVTSCYQKKANQFNERWTTTDGDITKDTIIDGVDLDSIAFVDTFKLLPIQVIYTEIKKNTNRPITPSIPMFAKRDTTITSNYVEQLAVNSTYYAFAVLSKNKNLITKSLKNNQQIAYHLFPNKEYPKDVSLDSLNSWIKSSFIDQNQEHEWIYFEAIEWLERLYITVEQPKNYSNKKNFQNLITTQLNNGVDMLNRISMHQEYEPLAHLMNYIITIVDCKYFEINASDIKSEVVDARVNCYLPTPTK